MSPDGHCPRTLPPIVVLGVIAAFDAMAIDINLLTLRDTGRFSEQTPARRRRRLPCSSMEPQSDNFPKRSNRDMKNSLPAAAAFGHFVMKVNDIDASYQFYTKLGLRPFGIFPDLAIIELRGGTHILLFSKNDELPSSLSSSHLGQRGASFNEQLDLMIDGKSKSDLELYRATLVEKGLSVDAIAQDQFFGHDYFQLVDPDGNGITIYTSHTEELSV
jgi:catechol 2,3-dioxygenase-like lactoylglutathione lyase family enzyme